jgi:hypothetical protein
MKLCTNCGGIIWATERVYNEVCLDANKGTRAKDVGCVPWGNKNITGSVDFLLGQFGRLQLEDGRVVVHQERGLVKTSDLRVRTWERTP